MMQRKDGCNSVELVYAALEGRKLERNPVHVPYSVLVHEDHWTELTGEPVWRFYDWLLKPEEHARIYRMFSDQVPFDLMYPARWRPNQDTNEFRANTKVVEKNGEYFFYYKKEDRYEKLHLVLHEAEESANEKQLVFSIDDIKEKVVVEKAEKQLENGQGDYIKACVQELGGERFIISGGILNTFYLASWYVGLTNVYIMVYDEPQMMDYLFKQILEVNIERIRMMAACGGDAIYVSDPMTTSDMISSKMYEQYALPYMKEQVREIHRLGKKAFIDYFGGIADRVELIAETGADALMMETTSKGFVNDYDDIASRLGGKMLLYTNLNPYDDVEAVSDEVMAERIRQAAQSAKKYGKYIISTGSPITPTTSLEKTRKFIEIARHA